MTPPPGSLSLSNVHYDGAKLRWANRRVHTAQVIFGEVLYEPGGYCGPRIQRHYELVVLHSGVCRALLDGQERPLTVGQVYLFLPGHREHFLFAEERETHHSYCSIEPAYMPERMRDKLEKAPFAVAQSEVFRLILIAAFKLRTPRHEATRRLIGELGLCLFAEHLHAAAQAERELSADRGLRSFLEHLEDHFAAEDCLEAAHRAAGVSRNTMIARFREALQTTPARYLWRLRTERGVAMLGETGHTISEIAYRCGFKNPFHFSRLVKQFVGASPREVRGRAWSPPPADLRSAG